MTPKQADELVDKAIELLAQHGSKIRYDKGKVNFETKTIEADLWRYVKFYKPMNCTLWKTVIFNCISMQLPPEKQFIPSGCLDCYKVVVRPQTYVQLFLLEDLMEKLQYPCKCGIETRETVRGLYGGYFYCRGVEEGRERYKQVDEVLSHDHNYKIWSMPKLILKRACTEYEQYFGPSDKWEMSVDQEEIEAAVDRKILLENVQAPQTEEMKKKIYARWQRFAYKYDFTYDGPNLQPEYVTYHKEE